VKHQLSEDSLGRYSHVHIGSQRGQGRWLAFARTGILCVASCDRGTQALVAPNPAEESICMQVGKRRFHGASAAQRLHHRGGPKKQNDRKKLKWKK